jgi:ATP-binding cassette subfamily F protein uup
MSLRNTGIYSVDERENDFSFLQLLERFYLMQKKQYDFVDRLSGGELKRLYLCTVLIQNPNFLILLDEPTNDLIL